MNVFLLSLLLWFFLSPPPCHCSPCSIFECGISRRTHRKNETVCMFFIFKISNAHFSVPKIIFFSFLFPRNMEYGIIFHTKILCIRFWARGKYYTWCDIEEDAATAHLHGTNKRGYIEYRWMKNENNELNLQKMKNKQTRRMSKSGHSRHAHTTVAESKNILCHDKVKTKATHRERRGKEARQQQ